MEGGGAFLSGRLAAYTAEGIARRLRDFLFDHIQRLSFAYHSATPTGDLIERVTSDVDALRRFFSEQAIGMGRILLLFFINWFAILSLNVKLGWLSVVVIPPTLAISLWFFKKVTKAYEEYQAQEAVLSTTLQENLTGVRVVKALLREDENTREFQGLTTQMYNASYRAAWLSALFLPSVQIIAAVVLGIIIGYSGVQIRSGLITLGGINAFVSYLTFMMWPIQDLARVYAEMQHSIASAERIFKLADTQPEVHNRPNAIPAATLLGEIEFDHVEFTYDERSPVLRDFSLKVQAGQTIALVGPTGGGKTTIVNLLCRFYEPTRGVIRINGRDYTEYTLESIHSKIGVVLQTPHLFSGTVRDNIRYGRLDATDDEIIA
ncbi:MAG: ABC transporter ATP-binding protein/permease, partial [Anaerolineales bacterium]|nr:ABC transporter ATP-binding protein/permease [Anaerolineales bacterium]